MLVVILYITHFHFCFCSKKIKVKTYFSEHKKTRKKVNLFNNNFFNLRYII